MEGSVPVPSRPPETLHALALSFGALPRHADDQAWASLLEYESHVEHGSANSANAAEAI